MHLNGFCLSFLRILSKSGRVYRLATILSPVQLLYYVGLLCHLEQANSFSNRKHEVSRMNLGTRENAFICHKQIKA